ncbi:glycosyltransferase involved in cell wall biosynthesis [Arthrobacter sp. UYP6]|uniref:glycosyltransferase family 4 protein n=1 Tax=Arthrobacter sp. UYP6 TaxID=1756378 RepID=UPI003392CE0A
MSGFTDVGKNICLVGSTAVDHIGDDPMMFALQVSRRLPGAITQAAAAAGKKLPMSSSLHTFALYLSGDMDATRSSLRRWTLSGANARKAVRLGQIALAAKLPDLADELVADVPPHSRGLAAFVSRRHWHNGAMGSAIDALGGGNRRDRRQRLRLESELRVFTGWRPHVEAYPNYSSLPRTVVHFLTNSLPHTSSGYAQRSHSLLKAQTEVGWTVHAVTRQGYPALVGKITGRSTETIDGVTYHRLLAARLPFGMDQRLQAQTEALLELCLRLRPEVLHTTSHFVNALVVSAVAEALGIPWVYEVRGLLAETWASERPEAARQSERHLRFWQREHEATKGADAVITLGHAMGAAITGENGCSAAKLILVPNAVGEAFLASPQSPAEARRRLGLDPEKLTIGTVSSLVSYEGLDDLVRAFAQLSVRYPDLRCLIVGDGAELARLKNLAHKLNVSERVTFPGRVDRTQSSLFHQALDIFVLPRLDLPVTRTVTPLKPVEALASSRPVVFSNLPALQETIRDGTEGLSAEAQNPAQLAAAVECLIADPCLRDRMGEAGRTRILAERTWQAAAAQTTATYERLKVARGYN